MPFNFRHGLVQHGLRSSNRFWLVLGIVLVGFIALAASARQEDNAENGSSSSSDNQSGSLAEASRSNPLATPPGIDSNAVYVTTQEVRSETNSNLERTFAGTIVAKRASDLGFKRTGRVIKLMADQGDRVQQGEVIAELDTAIIQTEMTVVRAQRSAAESKLEELVAGPRKQTIAAAQAKADELKASRDQAAMIFERRRKLAGGDAIAEQDVDDARLQLAASEGRLAAQKQIVAELEEGTRKEQIEAQRAMLAQLDAQLASLQVQLDESQLQAPFDALVARRMTDEGSIVNPGTVVIRLVEIAPPEIWVGVPPDFVSQLKAEQTYQLTIRERPRQAKVQAILPELDKTTRTQSIVMQLLPDGADSDDDLYSLGQIAQLHLKQESSREGYWLPLSALTQGVRGLWSAFVVIPADEEGSTSAWKTKRVDLEIVQLDTDRVLVQGTLRNGDRVVVEGVQKLANGQRVQLAAPEQE